jgi:fructokinase
MPVGDGVYKIFDINLRQNYYDRATLEDSLTRCNVLKLNDEELLTVSRMFGVSGNDYRARCRWFLERYKLRMVLLTCGEKGSYVFTAEEESFMSTPKVEVVNTMGAGDAFTAAFISAILAGRGITEAHRLAVDVSAFVCTQAGAMPALPDDLRSRI